MYRLCRHTKYRNSFTQVHLYCTVETRHNLGMIGLYTPPSLNFPLFPSHSDQLTNQAEHGMWMSFFGLGHPGTTIEWWRDH